MVSLAFHFVNLTLLKAGPPGRILRRAVRAFHRHEIVIRYGEVDQQGVAYNAHYLVYIDEALEAWLRHDHPLLRQRYDWDMMLVRSTIEWQGSVGSGDTLVIELEPSRWGGKSWTMAYRGTCEERPVFTADVVYVSVRRGSNEPIVTPAGVREALDPGREGA